MRIMIVLVLCLLMFRMMPMLRRRSHVLTALLFAVYLLLNLYMTLLRPQKLYYHVRLIPGWTLYAILTGIGTKADSSSLLEELVLNILFYIPLGYLLPSAFVSLSVPTTVRAETLRSRLFVIRPLVKILLISLMMSGITECIQLFCKLGLCETDDVINNCLGAFIGYSVFRAQRKKESISPDAALNHIRKTK